MKKKLKCWIQSLPMLGGTFITTGEFQKESAQENWDCSANKCGILKVDSSKNLFPEAKIIYLSMEEKRTKIKNRKPKIKKNEQVNKL